MPDIRSSLTGITIHFSLRVKPSPRVRREGARRPARLLGALLLAGILSGIPACSEKPADGGVTLVFKHSKLFGDPAAFERLLAQFERENPGVRIKDETLPSSSDEQHQFYAINLQARSSDFDVLALDVIWVAEFARAGWLRDITPLLPASERKDFFPGPVSAVTQDGRIYALPWFIDAGLLYYRQDLLAKYGLAPPRTWDELVHDARTVMAREPGLYGFVWQGKQYEGLVCNALEYLWSNGGGVMRNGRVQLDRPVNRQALGFMRDLIARYRVSPAFVTTLTEEPSREIFGQGKAVFLRNWPYAWRLFEAPGSAIRGKVGIMVLPHFPGNASAATLGGWQLGVNRYTRHAAQAEQLVRFLTSASTQKAVALAYGFSPPRRSLYRDPELKSAAPFLVSLEPVFESARPRPVSPFYVPMSQVLQTEFSAVVSGIKPPVEALAEAQQQVQELVRP
jgi:multiple sugar transport system substrate-binding protein